MDPIILTASGLAALYGGSKAFKRSNLKRQKLQGGIQSLEVKLNQLENISNLDKKQIPKVIKALEKEYPIKSTQKKFLFFKKSLSPDSWISANKLKLETQRDILERKVKSISPTKFGLTSALKWGAGTALGLYLLKNLLTKSPEERTGYYIHYPDLPTY